MASGNVNEDVDIYEDLPDYNLEGSIQKLEVENKILSQQVTDLSARVVDLQTQNTDLNRIAKNLKINISSLLKTVQIEIQRKDETIADLRQEREDLFFRRIKPNRKDSSPRMAERIQDSCRQRDENANRLEGSRQKGEVLYDKKLALDNTSSNMNSTADALPLRALRKQGVVSSKERTKSADPQISSNLKVVPITSITNPNQSELTTSTQYGSTEGSRIAELIPKSSRLSRIQKSCQNPEPHKSQIASEIARKPSSPEDDFQVKRSRRTVSSSSEQSTKRMVSQPSSTSSDTPVLARSNSTLTGEATKRVPEKAFGEEPKTNEDKNSSPVEPDSTSPKKRPRKAPTSRLYVKTRSSPRLSAKLRNSLQDNSNDGGTDVSLLEVLQLEEKCRTNFTNLPIPDKLSPLQDGEKSLSPLARLPADLISASTPLPASSRKNIHSGILTFSSNSASPNESPFCASSLTSLPPKSVPSPETSRELTKPPESSSGKACNEAVPLVKEISSKVITSLETVIAYHKTILPREERTKAEEGLTSIVSSKEDIPQKLASHQERTDHPEETPHKEEISREEEISHKEKVSSRQAEMSSMERHLKTREEPKLCSSKPTYPTSVNEEYVESAPVVPIAKNTYIPVSAVTPSSSVSVGISKQKVDNTDSDKLKCNSALLQCDFKVRRRTRVEMKMIIKSPLGIACNKSSSEILNKVVSRSPKTVNEVSMNLGVPGGGNDIEIPVQKPVTDTINKPAEKSLREKLPTVNELHSKNRDKSPRASQYKMASNEIVHKDAVKNSDVNGKAAVLVRRRGSSRSRSPQRNTMRENFPPGRSSHSHQHRHRREHRSPSPYRRPMRREEHRPQGFNFSRRSRSLSPSFRSRRRDQRKEHRLKRLPSDRKQREMMLFGKSPDRNSVQRDHPQRPVVVTLNVRRKNNVKLEDNEDTKAVPLSKPPSISLASRLVQTPLDFRERFSEVFSNTGESSESDEEFCSESESNSKDSDDSYRPKKRRKIRHNKPKPESKKQKADVG